MKILKKFFIIGLFSFIFLIGNVNATITDTYTQIFYSDSNIDLIEQYSSEINAIKTYIAQNGVRTSEGSWTRKYITGGQYAVIFKTNTFSSGTIVAGLGNITGNFDNYYSQYGSRFQFILSYTYMNFQVSNGVVTSATGNSYGSGAVEILYPTSPSCDVRTENCVGYIGNYYFDTEYLTSPTNFTLYGAENSSTIYVPLKVDDTVYVPSIPMSNKVFMDALMPVPVDPLVCSRTQVLGFVSGVSDFTFKVNGKSNALDYPIRGKFTFDYPSGSSYSSSDFNVEFIDYCPSGEDCEVTGSYELVCPSDTYSCYIEYSYNYIDDIDTDVSFGFKVSTISGVNMPSYMHFYNCFHNDAYYNITYSYTNSSGTITNDNILNNFMQDGSLPDTTGLSDTSLIPSGPVDSILTLPLNIMNSLLSTLNSSTCNPLVIPIPFSGGNLTLPCISTLYSKITGLNVFLNWFSGIFSAFLLYKYFIYLYKWVDDTLTFRENNHFGGF